ncbi:3-deoxy-manno-octulosonate cytidylyltransferase [Zavarzinia sp. CC-PAN008]|uniref:3-deoxy-manno-octulosonate cytidylyltransferase n=1 Tax=Zavarzinia sp. CC-PAN008 TaxID=3243332 RepID=UPI003F748377
MKKHDDALVVIPARLGSTRLPDKPLASIAGRPMIVHVWERAVAAGLGPVVVAAAEPAIADAVEAAGGRAVLTNPAHPSGSDRVMEAVRLVDPEARATRIINVQGDLPTLDPTLLRDAAALLDDPAVAIGTLAARIVREDERTNPNVVKAVVSAPEGAATGRALYFTRATAPHGDGPLWHHIGLYAWRRSALERFVGLAPSPLELREKLEQLRALEDGMRIDVAFVETVPLGVDTQADLDRARALLHPSAP